MSNSREIIHENYKNKEANTTGIKVAQGNLALLPIVGHFA